MFSKNVYFSDYRFWLPLVAIIFTLSLSLFQVSETHNAFVVRFGKVIRNIDQAGLYIKTPLMDEIAHFDKRILDVNLPAKEVIASDQKRLIIDAYAKYKITDTTKFYESVRNETGANIRIASILDSTMRQVIAKRPLIALLTTDRDIIMKEIQSILSEQSVQFGVNIIDVRIIKAELPNENGKAVFKRMITDREKEAKELRAQGLEEAQIIIATADKKATSIISQANLQASKIYGNSDSEAAKIYNRAFSKDPEFYQFYKTINVYNKNMVGKELLLTTDDELLKLLKKS